MAGLAGLSVGISKAGFGGVGVIQVYLMAELFGKSSVGVLLPMLVVADLIVFPAYRKHGSWLGVCVDAALACAHWNDRRVFPPRLVAGKLGEATHRCHHSFDGRSSASEEDKARSLRYVCQIGRIRGWGRSGRRLCHYCPIKAPFVPKRHSCLTLYNVWLAPASASSVLWKRADSFLRPC